MIRVTDQYFWNILFLFFYVALIVIAVLYLEKKAYLSYDELTLLDLSLNTLASFRVTRMFVYDSMTKFLREQFMDTKKVRNTEVMVKPLHGPRRTLSELVGCPWCFGVWATTFVTFFYVLTPYAYFPTLILALAGVATVIQLFANLVGHKAEQLKRENEKN